ncbi:phosphomethylpyrimidine kinase [Thermosinus carboxydivorans Nor1]|uniref:Hydroxymethylpyrimidine/phosphomethylpyrimidine kinase n=1 Tax=Thermosinus carboxydivorans Nor1 TaxID=401526 RepID=A1HQB0_9FIRM|nr:bifunctional hydroxymethylpyrimidine kinase/phosphomethylpyrimidine kinase [Thermosinus carboxydivorans]EAX47718.1 phosphomethylpyrimidine kinase [Thermosinus carboxydivorans Nor1]
MKKALTIAGSDSSGGAGIQADLKAFAANGVFGMSVITAVTAQNTQGVFAVQDIDPAVIAKQIEAVFEDIEVDAVKIGMVSRIETIETIAAGLKKYRARNVVVDPVMVSKSGYHLLNPAAESKLTALLLPLATVVTPNIPEAEVITGMKITSLQDMEEAAKMIHCFGPQNVLLKGGHRTDDATDILFDGNTFRYFSSPRIATTNTHGTGCTLSAAIAANLARGYAVYDAVALAKEYITTAIAHALAIGKGVGPTHHFYDLYKRAGVFIDE